MEWTVMIEGPDEFGEIQRAQVQIEKGFERLASGEIGLSIDDGKTIMSALQEFVVKQELATYALARRVCVSCERLRPVKDYTRRKIRTVFGTVAVKNPRWMGCRHCFPHFSMAFSVLGEICPDRATPELMEVTARLGSMLPYRKAAELLAEFLPIEPTESHQTVRKRTLTLGARQKINRFGERGKVRHWHASAHNLSSECRMIPCANSSSASILLISEARIKRWRVTLKSSSRVAVAADGGCRLVIISRRATLPSLKCGRGPCRPSSSKAIPDTERSRFSPDGAEIMKRLPKALPKPTTHIIDWFHLAMKIRPMQQIADHYRRLSADPLRDRRGHRRGNQGVEMEALAWASGTRDLRA